MSVQQGVLLLLMGVVFQVFSIMAREISREPEQLPKADQAAITKMERELGIGQPETVPDLHHDPDCPGEHVVNWAGQVVRCFRVVDRA